MPVINFFGSQKCVYNEENRLCKTTIHKPFMKAGKILGWSESVPGLGLNKKLLNFVITRKLRLVVHVESTGKDYWTTWDKILNFLESNNTEYKVGNSNWLNVISWHVFTRRIMPTSKSGL